MQCWFRGLRSELDKVGTGLAWQTGEGKVVKYILFGCSARCSEDPRSIPCYNKHESSLLGNVPASLIVNASTGSRVRTDVIILVCFQQGEVWCTFYYIISSRVLLFMMFSGY